MRYELTDYEWAATKPMLPNGHPGAAAQYRGRCREPHFPLAPAELRRAQAAVLGEKPNFVTILQKFLSAEYRDRQ